MNHSEAGRLGALKIRQRNIDAYNENPNHCKLCGKKIELTDKLTPCLARQKVFCSPECKNKNQSIVMRENALRLGKTKTGNYSRAAQKFCKICGKPVSKASKGFCSNTCYAEFKYNEYIEKWKRGEVNGLRGEYQLSTHIKKYIFKKYNNKCSECGWDKINPYTGTFPLEIHHKDGNFENNKEENLQLLCPCCHSLTPTYKNHNKSGRKARKKYT